MLREFKLIGNILVKRMILVRAINVTINVKLSIILKITYRHNRGDQPK